MKNNKFSPPPLQIPKIQGKAVAEYAAMSEAEWKSIGKSPRVKKYMNRYKKPSLFDTVRSWLKEHWIDFVTLLVTVTALLLDLIR